MNAGGPYKRGKMMKMNWKKTKVIIFGALLVPVAGLMLGGCASVPDTENTLSAAGFKVHLADTPEQLEKLEALPQHELTPQKRHGQIFWVYADADSKRLYVGTDDQHSLYQQAKADAEISAQDQNAAEANLMAAQVDAVDGAWGAWGPWY
jgi:hypothetical protein